MTVGVIRLVDCDLWWVRDGHHWVRIRIGERIL
jgi:hypothetical protein